MLSFWRFGLALNSNIASKIVYQSTLQITSDYTIRTAGARRTGNVVNLYLTVNNDGNTFPTGRFTLAVIGNSNYVPKFNQDICSLASTGINGVVNRRANVLLSGLGTVYVDAIDSDAKEISLTATFVVGD